MKPKNSASQKWISETELFVSFAPSMLTPNLRRKIHEANAEIPGSPEICLGADSVLFRWRLEHEPGAWRQWSGQSVGLSSACREILNQWIEAFEAIEADVARGESAPAGFKPSQEPPEHAIKQLSAAYPDAAAWDLGRLASINDLTPEEVIRRHLATTYVVAFEGFVDGFAYLEPLPGSPTIKAPRHESPRPKVPAGAVALGGPYCGVYPTTGPGGWNIIGTIKGAGNGSKDGSVADDWYPSWQPGCLVQFCEGLP